MKKKENAKEFIQQQQWKSIAVTFLWPEEIEKLFKGKQKWERLKR